MRKTVEPDRSVGHDSFDQALRDAQMYGVGVVLVYADGRSTTIHPPDFFKRHKEESPE